MCKSDLLCSADHRRVGLCKFPDRLDPVADGLHRTCPAALIDRMRRGITGGLFLDTKGGHPSIVAGQMMGMRLMDKPYAYSPIPSSPASASSSVQVHARRATHPLSPRAGCQKGGSAAQGGRVGGPGFLGVVEARLLPR